MLLLQSLPISKGLHGIPTDQSHGAAPLAGGCASADGPVGDGRTPGSGQERSPRSAAAAIPQPDDGSPSDGGVAGAETAGSPPPSDGDPASAPEADSSEPPPSERLAGTTPHRPGMQDTTPVGSRGPGLTLSEPCPVSGRQSSQLSQSPLSSQSSQLSRSPQTFQSSQPSRSPQPSLSPQSYQTSQTSQSSQSSQSPQSCQSTRFSRQSEVAEPTAGQTGEAHQQETCRQRYDKLFRYFGTLDSTDDCYPLTADSSSSSSSSAATGQRSSPVGSPLCSDRPTGAGSDDRRSSAGSAISVSCSDSSATSSSEEVPRSIGYAGFVGVPPQPAAGAAGGCVGSGSANFTCLRSGEPVSTRQGRAPRAIRGAGRARRPPLGGASDAACQASSPVPQTPAPVTIPAPTPVPARPLPAREVHNSVAAPVKVLGTGRLWRVPSGQEQAQRAEARRRPPSAGRAAEPLLPAAAWHQEFDELMGPCRGDRPLASHAGRLRYRQPAPTRDTLRQLRERICLGCSRAFPESNYFDVYYHVNTVYRWFNWKLDA